MKKVIVIVFLIAGSCMHAQHQRISIDLMKARQQAAANEEVMKDKEKSTVASDAKKETGANSEEVNNNSVPVRRIAHRAPHGFFQPIPVSAVLARKESVGTDK